MAIRRKDFYTLFDAHPKIERAWRHLEEVALVGMIEREAELLTFTPEQRYRRLMNRSPHLFQIIPRKYIASYLRMSPETLSRIKLS
jgi:CRP-like cAMP-binding protein